MDKDVTSAAVAETWAGGPSGEGSFVFMYMGTGIGCGIVLNDEVVRGTSGNAGEIGHIIVDPDGALCDCGQRGCVKVLRHSAGPRGAGRGGRGTGWFTPGQERAGGSGAFRRVVRTRLRRQPTKPWTSSPGSAVLVARAVSAVTNALDVDRVVFGGPFWTCLSAAYLELIPGLVEANSATRMIHGIEVVGTGVGEDVGAVGAACLVLEHTLAPALAAAAPGGLEQGLTGRQSISSMTVPTGWCRPDAPGGRSGRGCTRPAPRATCPRPTA